MDGRIMISGADRAGVEPNTYRLMLIETIRRREIWLENIERRRREARQEIARCDGEVQELTAEIMKLKSKLVLEYISSGESLEEAEAAVEQAQAKRQEE